MSGKYNEITISGKVTKTFMKETVCICHATGVGSQDHAEFRLIPDGEKSAESLTRSFLITSAIALAAVL